ncbi:MAG: ACP S-malonyltransferase [Oligoflexia bacterium]|nr:ACP S-malonyltransferase [Oligoflexia bacterium]
MSGTTKKKSIIIVFPGQGSQYVGMGKSFLSSENSQYKHLHEYFVRADRALSSTIDYPLSEIVFNGPQEKLKLTQNTQPALVTYEVALFSEVKKILDSKNIAIDFVLGHSVGEYSCLVAAEVLDFEDAVRVVNLRGKYMQEAVPVGVGKMIAILKVPEESVRSACIEASKSGDGVNCEEVMPANYNDPDQIVISGHVAACDRVIKILEERVAPSRVRYVPLEVSAPFHSTLMRPAAQRLESELQKIQFNKNKITYIANVDAKEYKVGSDPNIIRMNLVNQVAGSVLWSQSMKVPQSENGNVDNQISEILCIEVGPGKVLKGMIKKIRPEMKVISVCDENSFSELIKELDS